MKNRTSRSVLWLLVWMVLAAVPVAAQQPTSWQLQVFQVGVSPATGSPFYTLDLAAPVSQCSASIVVPTAPASPVNPRHLYWTHPDFPGQGCHADLSTTPSWLALPKGGPYPFALLAVNEAGPSIPGVGDDPFRRMDPAAAPTGVIVIR